MGRIKNNNKGLSLVFIDREGNERNYDAEYQK